MKQVDFLPIIADRMSPGQSIGIFFMNDADFDEAVRVLKAVAPIYEYERPPADADVPAQKAFVLTIKQTNITRGFEDVHAQADTLHDVYHRIKNIMHTHPSIFLGIGGVLAPEQYPGEPEETRFTSHGKDIIRTVADEVYYMTSKSELYWSSRGLQKTTMEAVLTRVTRDIASVHRNLAFGPKVV